MQFFPPRITNGRIIVEPLFEIFEEGIKCWKNAIVAQFIGRAPNFSLFQNMAKVLWGADEDVDVRPAGVNNFIIQLPNSSIRDRILETGPWHIQNMPIIMRKWMPDMETLDFNMSKMPMWIHLGNVPLELFTKNGLSYLASVLGNPLYMDRITANQQRLAFAKICVEVDVTIEIPKFIEVKRRNGSMITIFVDVPWWPPKCSHWRIFGHVDRSCPKKANIASTKVWIPKVSENKDRKSVV